MIDKTGKASPAPICSSVRLTPSVHVIWTCTTPCSPEFIPRSWINWEFDDSRLTRKALVPATESTGTPLNAMRAPVLFSRKRTCTWVSAGRSRAKSTMSICQSLVPTSAVKFAKYRRWSNGINVKCKSRMLSHQDAGRPKSSTISPDHSSRFEPTSVVLINAPPFSHHNASRILT